MAATNRRPVLLIGSFVLVVLLLSLLGIRWYCLGEPVVASDLEGTYSADNRFARMTLTIEADGKFIQSVTLVSDGDTALALGMWSFSPSDNYIRFDNQFINTLREFGTFNPSYSSPHIGSTALPVRKFLGQITIGGRENQDYEEYRKH